MSKRRAHLKQVRKASKASATDVKPADKQTAVAGNKVTGPAKLAATTKPVKVSDPKKIGDKPPIKKQK